MDDLKQNKIREIAQELDCGNDCYYNSKTEEIIAIPNSLDLYDEEELEELFGDVYEKINHKNSDYIKFEVLESFESFKIMEHFTEQIPDPRFKWKLEDILQRKKPFQNFKNSIDNSDYRQDWFDFKQSELEKIVKLRYQRAKDCE